MNTYTRHYSYFVSVTIGLVTTGIVGTIVALASLNFSCLPQDDRRWKTYVSKDGGFSVQYPSSGYFMHVNSHATGLQLDNHPVGAPLHGVAGAEIRLGLVHDKHYENPVSSLATLLAVAKKESQLYEVISIVPSMICGRQVVRAQFNWKIGESIYQKYSTVYFVHGGKIIRAWLIIGPNYMGKPEEIRYTQLFEDIIHTIRLFPE